MNAVTPFPLPDTFESGLLLPSRAMLVTVKISKWSARKLDKRVTRETNDLHGASEDAGRYNKLLAAGEALDAVNKLASQARDYAYSRTLPWFDNGARILPTEMFFDFERAMGAFVYDFDRAIEMFAAAYPQIIDDARDRLGSMFSVEDYPPVLDIRDRFALRFDFMPLPDVTDFRVDVGAEAEQRIKARMVERLSAAQDDAMRELWERLHACCEAMAERLTDEPAGSKREGKPKIFKDSLVDNVRDLVEILPKLNVTGDADLDRMANRVRERLTRTDAKGLRESDGERARVQHDAAEISDQMRGFM